MMMTMTMIGIFDIKFNSSFLSFVLSVFPRACSNDATKQINEKRTFFQHNAKKGRRRKDFFFRSSKFYEGRRRAHVKPPPVTKGDNKVVLC